MQANIALGLLEISSIAGGIETLDAMRKMAEINVEAGFAIAKGKYLIIISGAQAEVESSVFKGTEISGKDLIAKYVIKNVHKKVLEGLNKKKKIEKIEAVGVIETKEALSAVFAADAALKAAFVDVVEIKTGQGIGGKGYCVFNGEVASMRTAIAAGVKAIGESEVIKRVVISQAHEDMIKVL